jgi:hypothetical protein
MAEEIMVTTYAVVTIVTATCVVVVVVVVIMVVLAIQATPVTITVPATNIFAKCTETTKRTTPITAFLLARLRDH